MSLAIHAAICQNRFAAMDTCTEMIKGISSEELGVLVRDVILGFPDSFLDNIDVYECKSDAIRGALAELKTVSAAERALEPKMPWETK